MPFHRTRRRSRMSALQPINSYKTITVDGPASRAAATNIDHNILTGIDGSTTGANVQTGSKLMSVLIFASFTNLVAVSSLLHFNVGILRGGSAFPTPGAVGGSTQRNQIIFTHQAFLGQNQNSNFIFRLKIPKVFQRVREGDVWRIRYRTDTVFASATQAIYKTYR